VDSALKHKDRCSLLLFSKMQFVTGESKLGINRLKALHYRKMLQTVPRNFKMNCPSPMSTSLPLPLLQQKNLVYFSTLNYHKKANFVSLDLYAANPSTFPCHHGMARPQVADGGKSPGYGG